MPWICSILPIYKHTLCLLKSNHSTMAIKSCKVSIKCFVMCLYKMYLTITSNFTLTITLLWYITCIYSRFLHHYQSQCCHWNMLQHAASGCNFLQFHSIHTLFNMKHFLHAWAVLLTSLRATTSNGLGHWLWPRWGSGLSLAPVLLHSEPIRTIHMAVFEVCWCGHSCQLQLPGECRRIGSILNFVGSHFVYFWLYPLNSCFIVILDPKKLWLLIKIINVANIHSALHPFEMFMAAILDFVGSHIVYFWLIH